MSESRQHRRKVVYDPLTELMAHYAGHCRGEEGNRRSPAALSKNG